MNSIITFIRSPHGKSTHIVFRNLMSSATLESALNTLNAENKAAVESFIQSPAGMKVGELLTSIEFKYINTSYGELLGCRYFYHSDSSKLENLRKNGKCLNI